MKVYLTKAQYFQGNACILYAPGYEQYYKAVHRFRNSYLHFSCKADLKNNMESRLILFFIRETVKRLTPASGSFTKNI